MTHKKPVGVLLLSLPNTRNGSRDHSLLDRIDIHIEVPRVDYEKLSGDRMGETSEAIRKRVQAARNIQQQRFASSQSDIICNADMRVGEIRQFCQLQDEGQNLMREAMTPLNLSTRAYHRILKLARTIADLAGSKDIQSPHLAEALQYRPKEDHDGVVRINLLASCICRLT
jgi:magnesium chelatase family protein